MSCFVLSLQRIYFTVVLNDDVNDELRRIMMNSVDFVQLFRLHIGERRVESDSHPRHNAPWPGRHAAVRRTGRLRRSSASQTVYTRQTREHDRCVAV